MRSDQILPLFRWAMAFVACFLFLTCSAAQEPKTKTADIRDVAGQRVFVCGHSFHNYLFGRFGGVAKAAGIKGHKDVNLQFLGNSRVLQHWNLADDKDRVRKAIRTGEVDVLTLSPNVKVPDEGIDKFTDLLLEHNPNGRVYIQASWYPMDLPGKTAKNFTNADRDTIKVADLRDGYKPFYEAVTKQVVGINERLEDKQKRPVVFVVPVGHAVYTLREQIALGKVPGITKQSDLFRDATGHAHPPIAALGTYCYFAAVYQRTPVGLPMPRMLTDAKNPVWDEAFNRTLQEIAWQAVSSEPLSGVKKVTDNK